MAGVRVAVAGASGRMGQALIEAVLASSRLSLSGALDVAPSAAIGSDAGQRIGRTTGVLVTDDIDAVVSAADVLIDFTRPEGTLRHLAACARNGTAAVVGTTGLDADSKLAIGAHAKAIPIVLAANMSVGVAVLAELVELAANRLGASFDVEIVEMHHRHKVDAPSGTALRLGEAAAAGAGVDFGERAVFSRAGVTGERPAGAIGFATLRGGDVVGEHTVIFAGDGERIELTHRATSRRNFAAGALRAAQFVAAKRASHHAGLYDMADVLGFRDHSGSDHSGSEP